MPKYYVKYRRGRLNSAFPDGVSYSEKSTIVELKSAIENEEDLSLLQRKLYEKMGGSIEVLSVGRV